MEIFGVTFSQKLLKFPKLLSLQQTRTRKVSNIKLQKVKCMMIWEAGQYLMVSESGTHCIPQKVESQ